MFISWMVIQSLVGYFLIPLKSLIPKWTVQRNRWNYFNNMYLWSRSKFFRIRWNSSKWVNLQKIILRNHVYCSNGGGGFILWHNWHSVAAAHCWGLKKEWKMITAAQLASSTSKASLKACEHSSMAEAVPWETPAARFMLSRRGSSSSSQCAIRTQFYLTSWRCIL